MNDQTIDAIGKVATYELVNREIQVAAKTVIFVGTAVIVTAAAINVLTGKSGSNNENRCFNPMQL